MSETLTARHIMQKEVLTLEPEMTLREAWEFFRNNRIGGAPVVSGKQGLVGVLSQSDMLRETFDETEDFPPRSYYLSSAYWDNPVSENILRRLDGLIVEDVMNRQVFTASPEDAVPALAALMRGKDVHRLIVVEGGKVVGILTAHDLLKVLENH